jgi:hypothetical protein
MKKTTLTILSLLIAGFAFSEEEKTPQLVIGKILPKREKPDPGNKKPEIDKEKPARPNHKTFPPHWGKPPAIQTKDFRPLPAGFGMGSSTLARWILEHIKEDKERPVKHERPKRPEPSEEVKAKLAAVKLVQNDLSIARKDLRIQLKDKSKEDIANLIQRFRETQKEKFQQLKVAQKALREEVRSKIQTGARRE